MLAPGRPATTVENNGQYGITERKNICLLSGDYIAEYMSRVCRF